MYLVIALLLINDIEPIISEGSKSAMTSTYTYTHTHTYTDR